MADIPARTKSGCHLSEGSRFFERGNDEPLDDAHVKVAALERRGNQIKIPDLAATFEGLARAVELPVALEHGRRVIKDNLFPGRYRGNRDEGDVVDEA
jgi:hypothetical protein